jgi:hypothetical protein
MMCPLRRPVYQGIADRRFALSAMTGIYIGMNILELFREKYQEVQQKYNIGRKAEVNKSKGVKM